MTFPQEVMDMRPILIRLPWRTMDNILSMVYQVEEGVMRNLFHMGSIPICMKIILEKVGEEYSFTMGITSVYSKYEVTYKNPRGLYNRLDGERAYYVDSSVFTRTYYQGTDTFSGLEITPMEICILDTWIGVSRADSIHYPTVNDNRSLFPERQLPELLQQRVVRTGRFEDRSELICKAEIKPDAFRNLLNKCGKPENRLSIIMRDNKIGVVKDGEAYDVVSYYKANNVRAPDSEETIYCDTDYKELYSLLYRRKVGRQGIFERLTDDYTPESICFGISHNGKLCLEIPDLESGGSYLIECPNMHDIEAPTFSKIKTKAYRQSSTRVATKEIESTSQGGNVESKYDLSSNYPEVILSEEVENTAYVLTDEDEVRMSTWREVHTQRGGTSEDPKRWFADFTLHHLQNGLSIPQEDLDLASKF
jgi:hypothetical protein